MNQQAKLKLGTLNYLVNMRPVFNTDALFSDETANYVTPMEPKEGESVKIRFRTERDNVDNVYFISGATKKKMRLEKSRENFDYYVTEILMGSEIMYYYFEIQAGKVRCFYNKCGVSRDLQQSIISKKCIIYIKGDIRKFIEADLVLVLNIKNISRIIHVAQCKRRDEYTFFFYMACSSGSFTTELLFFAVYN